MNKLLLNTGVQDFINKNWNADIMSVLLKKPIFEGISQKELVEQLEAKKKCREKLPTWFSTPLILYPNKLHIEQTSSGKTAAYKAELIDGKTLVDASGGLGVDTFYFAKKLQDVYHCEINEELSAIAQHNFQVLGQQNIHPMAVDGLRFLEKTELTFDWIYVDPSRRTDLNRKVVLLKDCLPNVPEHLSVLFEKTENILIKTSPILDIQKAIGELKFVDQVHIVAVDNEVKEVLYLLKKGFSGEIMYKAVNLTKEGRQVFEFRANNERNAESSFGLPTGFLYEPNAAVLKAGAFKLVGERFDLKKMHPNSHLYTSDTLVPFPGRTFKVKHAKSYSQRTMKAYQKSKANITVRNFPFTVAEIRKKYRIGDGGNTFLFFTKTQDNALWIIECEKV